MPREDQTMTYKSKLAKQIDAWREAHLGERITLAVVCELNGGADLGGADLGGADLRGADLGALTFSAGPSGDGWLIRLDAEGKATVDGEWTISIGCWLNKTLDQLRDLIEDKVPWPEAEGAERERRRPYLRAVLALCEAHIAYGAAGGAE